MEGRKRHRHQLRAASTYKRPPGQAASGLRLGGRCWDCGWGLAPCRPAPSPAPAPAPTCTAPPRSLGDHDPHPWITEPMEQPAGVAGSGPCLSVCTADPESKPHNHLPVCLQGPCLPCCHHPRAGARWRGPPSPKPARTSQPASLSPWPTCSLAGPTVKALDLTTSPPVALVSHVVTSHLYQVRPGPASPKPPGPWGLREGGVGLHQPP